MSVRNMLKEFRSAAQSRFRGVPFWAWNGRLEPGELRHQIRIMKAMGLGGFFMHSRIGLETPYLSDEWFECIDTCIDEAKKTGMEAWLYDEDRWPSGAAGGLVTKNPEHRMRRLTLEVLKPGGSFKWTRGVLAAFAAALSRGVARNARRLRKGGTGKRSRGESILVFREEVTKPSNWYNGYTYLDTMSREAVREFIGVTYEAYRKRCGGHFGELVPGIFTDEPNHGEKLSESMPWTPKLPQVFRKRYGYDLAEHLVELFYDVEGVEMSRARYHYHDCVTHLFVDAFARQLGQWCEKNGILFTGHVLSEETLASQTNVVGSCMRFYEHMQAPGMDILTEYNREYDTAKQVSSAARQFDRRWRLTETYGCTGWDFPLMGHKAVGDWQAALGINLRCQHLSWYTMEGEAKRDYPAAIFYQSPWWELYPKVEDYFARVHLAMTKGREVRDLLVIHPVESMWTLCRADWREDPAVHKLNLMLVGLRDFLLAENLDFDYGDEELLSRHAGVSKRKGQPVLRVGRAQYKAVIVPPLRTIRSTTLKLLEKFADAGGLVVFAGPVPEFVDARQSDAASILARRCRRVPAKGRKLIEAVAQVSRRVSITDSSGQEIPSTLHLLREDGQAFYLFVCNTGHDFRKCGHEDLPVRRRTLDLPDVRVRGFAECRGTPVEMDPGTGEAFMADAKKTPAGWEIRTSMAPVGSRIFVIPKKKMTLRVPLRRILKDVRSRRLGSRRWNISLSESNVVVLDRPRFRIGAGQWRGPDEILRVDRVVRDALGIPHRGGDMMQPWARPKPAQPRSVPVEIVYSFEVNVIPSGDLFLAIEHPGTYQIRMNDSGVNTDVDCGWWCDRSLRKLRLDPASLRRGENELGLKCLYDELHPGLEIVYLLGSFGVKLKGTSAVITEMPRTLALGDWVKQGLPFYSGSVSYHTELRPKLRRGERLFVQVPDYFGCAVRVFVDGRAAGVIAWEPNEVEITEFVGKESVFFCIEVIGHRRNSHGPLHLTDRNPPWVGPRQFLSAGKLWSDDYVLKPCGLMSAPKLVVRRQVL